MKKKNTLTIVLATRNRGKLEEFRELLGDPDIELLCADDYRGIRMPPENGETFSENAIIKARYVSRVTGEISLSDDSGLVVDALGGKPGVHSKRFGGPAGTDSLRNRKLLSMMKDRNDRKASFICAIAIADPSGSAATVMGQCHGEITREPHGAGGFGYDPVFMVPFLGKTFSQISTRMKNRISHRGKALRKAAKLIRTKYAWS